MLLGAFLLTLRPMLASAEGPSLWNQAQSFTAFLEGKSATALKAAAAAVAATVVDAKMELKNAKNLLGLAKASNGGAGLSAGTIASLIARVASADAAVAAAATAAGIVAAVGGGAIIGTYTRQYADWGISKVWGLFSSLGPPPHPIGPGIYVQPTDQQLAALVPTLASGAFGLTLTSDMFAAAGSAGLLAERFITQAEDLSIIALRGGAAATVGRTDQVLLAASDLAAVLRDYRTTTEQMANLLKSTSFQSPVAALDNNLGLYDTEIAQAKSECTISGLNCTDLDSLLDQSRAAFARALAAAASLDYPSLVGGSQAVLQDLTLTDFHDFLVGASLFGAAALPQEEIFIADELVSAAGVFFPGFTSVGALIAAWDATGDPRGREAALFDPQTGIATNSDLLLGTSTALSCGTNLPCDGPWLGIDPFTSPLITIPEPNTLTLVLIALAVIGSGMSRRRSIRIRLSN